MSPTLLLHQQAGAADAIIDVEQNVPNALLDVVGQAILAILDFTNDVLDDVVVVVVVVVANVAG